MTAWRFCYFATFGCLLRRQEGKKGLATLYTISLNIVKLWNKNARHYKSLAEEKNFPVDSVYRQFWPRAFLVTSVAIHMMLQPIVNWQWMTRPPHPLPARPQPAVAASRHRHGQPSGASDVARSVAPHCPPCSTTVVDDPNYPFDASVSYFDEWFEDVLKEFCDSDDDRRRIIMRHDGWHLDVIDVESGIVRIRNGLALQGGRLDPRNRRAAVPLASNAFRLTLNIIPTGNGARIYQVDTKPACRGLRVVLHILPFPGTPVLEGVMRGDPHQPGMVFHLAANSPESWPHTAAFRGGVVEWYRQRFGSGDTPDAGVSVVADLIDIDTLWRVLTNAAPKQKEILRALKSHPGFARVWHGGQRGRAQRRHTHGHAMG